MNSLGCALTDGLRSAALAAGLFRFHVWPLLLLAAAMAGQSALAQAGRPPKEWTHLAAPPPDKAGAPRSVEPVRGKLFRLDRGLMHDRLAGVARGEPAAAVSLGTEIELPMPDGTLARFKIVEAPVMATELAAKFPEIKTYAGRGLDDPHATVRLDLSPLGFHAQVLSPRGAVYVDPAYHGDANLHVSYYKRDARRAVNDFECLVAADAGVTAGAAAAAGDEANKVQSGPTLRTYRLAVACTGEYATYFGGTVPNAMAAIVAAVNRVNGVYETELAVRLVLITNNEAIVYTDGGTDPYSNGNVNAMLGQNQTNLDNVIGTANYDVGHVFCTSGGGIASISSVCNSATKARGVSGSAVPSGDSFWIDILSHEMGHQFGGSHTFNATSASCSGNRDAPTAFEPGSGSTIMAYAGTCSPNNLQLNSDPYFHGGSLDQIQAFLAAGGGSCAAGSATGNSAPSISAGGNYTIPASTPFVLTASGSDPDSDPLTYCWEEMDLGPAAALSDPDQGSIPLFRSLPPTNSPLRYLPRLSSVLANTNWSQEKLPTTSRTMTFRVTARDNRSGGGGVADAEMTVTSVAGTGPFRVTSPNTPTNWYGARTVTWDVAGSASAPINTTGVNIFLSTNGGNAFQFQLATNVPNTGSAVVVLPNLNSTQARIKVEGAGNIFYDISDANFTVIPGNLVVILLSGTALVAESCTPTNGLVDPYETVTVNWSLTNAGTAPTTNLIGTLLTSNGVYYPSAPQNYGVIAAGGTATRSFSFTAAGICGGSLTSLVQLTDGPVNLGLLTNLFSLGPSQVALSTQVFQNVSSISIPSSGTATPYPSVINVSGVTNPVVKLTARVNGLSHTFPEDIDMMLMNSNAQTTVMLMGGCGGADDLSGVNLTFDDAAAGNLPTSQITSGTYRPTDYFGDTMSPPAPAGPYGSTLTPLATNPNGPWTLYIQDVTPGDSGMISGGWTLTFVTSNLVAACCSSYPPPSFTSTTRSNNAMYFSWTTLPGLQYQVQSRTNLTLGTWVNFGSPFTGTGGLLTTNNLVAGDLMRFFRVVVGP